MQWTSALPIVGVVSRHHHHPSEGSTPRGPLIFNEALHSTSWHPLGADIWWRQTWEKWSKREEHLVPWFFLCCDSPSKNKCDTLAPFPRGRKPQRGYRLILCPLAWFLQVLLGCSCPSAWHFMAQNFGITCQPECVTLCSDPGRVRKTKYDLIHLHPNTCMLISIQLSCLQISFTSLTKLCILALLSLQNVQITLFWVVLNKTSKGPDSWGDLLKATS